MSCSGFCPRTAFIPRGYSFLRSASRARFALVAGIVAAVIPCTLLAQRGGGGGGHNKTPVICVYDCSTPEGVDTEDALKDFRRTIALQATPDQRAAFATISQYTQAASDQLKTFREFLQKAPVSMAANPGLLNRATALDQAIDKARAGNENFLHSFSEAQKSGLKEVTTKLAKADSELDKEIKTLDQIAQTSKPDGAQILNSAASLEKDLDSFQTGQLAIAREMGTLSGEDSQRLTFSLPKITNSIAFAGQTLSIPTSGAVAQVSADNGGNLFRLELAADLSDAQVNITDILRASLNRAPGCGEHVEVRQGSLAPVFPAAVVTVQLHFERWACPLGSRQQYPVEVAASDGTMDVKLTPSVNEKTGLALGSEITRVEATGFLRDLLHSGDLGITLRDEIAASFLALMRNTADLKTALPPMAPGSATIQKAVFQDAGAGQLNMVLDGELQLSGEQMQQFVAQLKQRSATLQSAAP